MFSLIFPLDGEDRLKLFINTYEKYKEYGYPFGTEFIVVTRTLKKEIEELYKEIKVIEYKHEGNWFNPSKALNLGVKHSTNDNIIITCPEVIPNKDILKFLKNNNRDNYLFEVMDEYPNGNLSSLVNYKYRGDTVAMYFLALFKKEDIISINGWDLKFMEGYAWEDTDFGNRFKRMGLTYKLIEGHWATHKWHPRGGISEGWSINKEHINFNDENKITRCSLGLNEVEENE